MKHFAAIEDYPNRKAVVAAYPSATVIRKVCGGWMVFEYASDYEIWKGQK